MNSNWPDIELLEDYLDGKLDSKAMHKIERQALDDPFVAQALAGLSGSPGRAVNSVSLLQKQLYERIAQQQVTKKETVFTWQRLSVAAAAAVMFISVSIMFFMKNRETREQLAKHRTKKIEVNIAPAPSVIDSARNDIYATNVPVKKIKPVIVGQVNSKRAIQGEAAMDRAVQPYAMQSAPVKAMDSPGMPVHELALGRMSKAMTKVAQATATAAVSTPVGGWANLNAYLDSYNKLTGAKDKSVELNFLIDSTGKPSDIKVTKGVNKQFDEEAIRLINEGPRWEQPESPESRMSYTIVF